MKYTRWDDEMTRLQESCTAALKYEAFIFMREAVNVRVFGGCCNLKREENVMMKMMRAHAWPTRFVHYM